MIIKRTEVETVVKTPGVQITLTNEQADWVYALLSDVCSPDAVQEMGLGEFKSNLRLFVPREVRFGGFYGVTANDVVNAHC